MKISYLQYIFALVTAYLCICFSFNACVSNIDTCKKFSLFPYRQSHGTRKFEDFGIFCHEGVARNYYESRHRGISMQQSIQPDVSNVPIPDSIFSKNEAVQRAVKGRPHTEQSRAKIGAANKGKFPWNKGRTMNNETRTKISESVQRYNLNRNREFAEKLGLSLEEYQITKKKKRLIAKKSASSETKSLETSLRLKEKWKDPEYRNAMLDHLPSRKGILHTEESRAKISEAVKKLWEDPDYRAKARMKQITPEAREKMSKLVKAKWNDPAYREKALSGKRKPRSEDHAKRISEAIKAKWQDPSYRQKTVESMNSQRQKAMEERRKNPITRLKKDSNTPPKPRKSRAKLKQNASWAEMELSKDSSKSEVTNLGKKYLRNPDFQIELKSNSAVAEEWKNKLESQFSTSSVEANGNIGDTTSTGLIFEHELVVHDEYIVSRERSGRVKIRLY